MAKVFFVPVSEIRRVRSNIDDPIKVCRLLCNIFRINVLSMIMETGSGHVGGSFSSMDIITWLWTQEMRMQNQKDASDSDIFFSSKGHDVPALYSLLIGLEKLDYQFIHKLRRLGGLPGHPDIHTPYIATNTGSLGMGISKARGMAIANRLSGKKGRIYVLCGDGELQEGQFWESLQPTANGKFSEITVIVDHNKMQSDTWVSGVSDIGPIEDKFRAFGWEVARCDGHDFEALKTVFAHFRAVIDRPQILISDTQKVRGISFMETGPSPGELYKFHSGVPDESDYQQAINELAEKVNAGLAELNQHGLTLDSFDLQEKKKLHNPAKLVDAYGDELIKIAKENNNIVALDADLMKDCGLTAFKNEFPDRFIECGIAEQDMVSLAGGLALAGKIPIAHSFACFLSTRPNEQIYNNASEFKKIIYVGSLAGLLPATPGHSHQSVRDISALGSIPNLIMIEPSCEKETRMALRWAVEKNKFSAYLRLLSIPCQLSFALPDEYHLQEGTGVSLTEGTNAILFAYGPVMLSEAVKAAWLLEARGIELKVINLPWLNFIDKEWLIKTCEPYGVILTIDDHYVKFGQGNLIAVILARPVLSLGLSELPECGQPDEVLKHHHLDAQSIVEKIQELVE